MKRWGISKKPSCGRILGIVHCCIAFIAIAATRYIYIYQLVLGLILSFWTTSIQYPSGSKTKAILCIRPSVRRFLNVTWRDSKRSHAAWRSSTEIPNAHEKKQLTRRVMTTYRCGRSPAARCYHCGRRVPLASRCHSSKSIPAGLPTLPRCSCSLLSLRGSRQGTQGNTN